MNVDLAKQSQISEADQRSSPYLWRLRQSAEKLAAAAPHAVMLYRVSALIASLGSATQRVVVRVPNVAARRLARGRMEATG